MESLEPSKRSEWVKFITLTVALGVMAAALAALLAIVLAYARGAAGPLRAWLVRFAILCVAMLGLTLVVLFWLVVRFVAARVQTPWLRSRTEHVDAWKLAGQRAQVPEEDEPAEGEDESDSPPPA